MPEHQQTQQSKKTNTIFQNQATPVRQTPVSNPYSIIQRAKINPKSLTYADIMQLQRTIGNQAVGKLLSGIGSSSTAQQAPIQRQEIPEEETCPSCMQRQEIPEEEEPLQGKMIGTIQRQEIPEEEEPLQGKFENKPEMACPSCFAAPIVQRQEMPEEEEPLQGKMIGTIQRQEIPEEEEPPQTKRENNTGMPDNLKAGVESLSGIDMSDVRVHYNSSKPPEVGALAYAQGANIHVAPGQEKHLPHEAWHVVQQKQGRVQATTQMKGLGINDDLSLENEADMMGAKTAQFFPAPDEEMMQGKFGERMAQKAEEAPNNMEMPENLKDGIESLYGINVDGMGVHYNSGKPMKQIGDVLEIKNKKGLNNHLQTKNTTQLKGWLTPKRRNEVMSQYNQIQAWFKGSKSTPILREVTIDEVVDLLSTAAENGSLKQPVRELLNNMMKNHWCITAGAHVGGLGGMAGDADPELHISINVAGTGYHLRVKEDMMLWDITGPNLSLTKGKAEKDRRENPAPPTSVELIMRDFDLTEKDALDALKYKTKMGWTMPTAVAYVKSGRPNLAMRTRAANGDVRRWQYDAKVNRFVLKT